MRRSLRTLGLFLLFAAASGITLAREAGFSEWPVGRLVENLEARLVEKPDDAETHYTLGRTHAFAFALESSSVWATGSPSWEGWGTRRGPWVKDLDDQHKNFENQRVPESERPAYWKQPLDLPPPTPSELLEHLSSGVRYLQRACELKPTGYWAKYYELTLAWLLETGAHLAERIDTTQVFHLGSIELTETDVATIEHWLELWSSDDVNVSRNGVIHLIGNDLRDRVVVHCVQHPLSSDAKRQQQVDELQRRYWLEQSIEHYRRALEASIAETLDDGERTWSNVERSFSWEASQAYLRLVRERGYLDRAEETYANELEGRLKELEKLPAGGLGISPILLTLNNCASLSDLTTPDLTVPFDLDGDGIDELWPWIAPDAGWLVWDPHQRGEILSGRQLFGTASGWLFFSDGYRVLDALDDDRDRRLSGAELAGIAVWFDRDSDGISDAGEVVPVEELGIAALATEATETIGVSLGNPCGLELTEGRVLPTYDWFLEPATSPDPE